MPAYVPVLMGLGFCLLRSLEFYQDQRVMGGVLAQAEQALARGRLRGAEAARKRQEAMALFDGLMKEAEGGRDPRVALRQAEQAFQKVLALEVQADADYLHATDILRGAFLSSRAQQKLWQRLRTALRQRLLLAEQGHKGPKDDLRRELLRYDPGDAERQWLLAPAHLQVQTRPAGTLVRLGRYEDTGTQKRLSPLRDLGRTPLSDVSLPPGSYLLLLEAQGRPALRYPVLLLRGEQRRLDLDIPRAVPEGYVYVAPGCFLFGSADDEETRRGFLEAPPLHRVCTAGYLIGRNEVTFAEWLDYLMALPVEERRRRAPFVPGQRRMVKLEQLPDGAWELSFQPTTRVYSARLGEPIRYAERERRAEQDWRRFPVSGVSFEDAQAYLSWLGRSGRLPGARLCDEHEWERAGRGADERNFPHGDRMAPDDANIDETYGRQALSFGPDEVGSHPASASPFLVNDLSGNVWEFVRSVRAPSEVVYRGGAWYFDQPTDRLTNREMGERTTRHITVGLRVCADPAVLQFH